MNILKAVYTFSYWRLAGLQQRRVTMNEAGLSPLWVFSFVPGKYPRARTFPHLGHDSLSGVCFVDVIPLMAYCLFYLQYLLKEQWFFIFMNSRLSLSFHGYHFQWTVWKVSAPKKSWLYSISPEACYFCSSSSHEASWMSFKDNCILSPWVHWLG